MLPLAIVGEVLILLGIILSIDWTDDDEPPVPITGTTTTVLIEDQPSGSGRGS